jgi:hypothetical protein
MFDTLQSWRAPYIPALRPDMDPAARQMRLAQARNAGGWCPITHVPVESVEEPYIGEDNVVYERAALAQAMARGLAHSPWLARPLHKDARHLVCAQVRLQLWASARSVRYQRTARHVLRQHAAVVRQHVLVGAGAYYAVYQGVLYLTYHTQLTHLMGPATPIKLATPLFMPLAAHVLGFITAEALVMGWGLANAGHCRAACTVSAGACMLAAALGFGLVGTWRDVYADGSATGPTWDALVPLPGLTGAQRLAQLAQWARTAAPLRLPTARPAH